MCLIYIHIGFWIHVYCVTICYMCSFNDSNDGDFGARCFPDAWHAMELRRSWVIWPGPRRGMEVGPQVHRNSWNLWMFIPQNLSTSGIYTYLLLGSFDMFWPFFVLPGVGNSHPTWLYLYIVLFRGVETTNRIHLFIWYIHVCYMFIVFIPISALNVYLSKTRPFGCGTLSERFPFEDSGHLFVTMISVSGNLKVIKKCDWSRATKLGSIALLIKKQTPIHVT